MTQHDFAQMYATLPELAEPGTDLRATRRKNELRRMLEAHIAGGRIQILRIGGDASYGVATYDVLVHSPHLVYTCFDPWTPNLEIVARIRSGRTDTNSLKLQKLLPVRIELPPTHPDRAHPPVVTLLDHRVFHPSVVGSAVCWAERWKTTFLVDMLAEISALLRFERASNLQSPLNPQAARWFAEGHKGFDLPLA